ncbi:hypothetical protein [Pedobacter mendelii]|uniref:CHRD domain-containing protein n=1 Tax=Pedobacter mendelii TaxID=1908240 RepID=A0ABQ2BH04_9SPHI|nr:hypothetical protein [Pedobacter mendelii]GGI23842.1 hypothetical protein GCM10008119_09680 [Pedobacter mendelii]
MKTLKKLLTYLPLFALMITFASCKKNTDEVMPTESMDMTKFYIAGKYNTTFNGTAVSIPYILTFDPLAQTVLTYGIVSNRNGNYVYDNGTLTITWNANSKDVFKISNGNITSYEGNAFSSYKLQNIPETNLLSGNTYNGSLKAPGSTIFLLTKLKFSATQYGEGSFGDPTINKDYTLIKNVAATSNTGANGTLSFFLLLDGKLEVSRFTPTNVNGSGNLTTGTLQ